MPILGCRSSRAECVPLHPCAHALLWTDCFASWQDKRAATIVSLSPCVYAKLSKRAYRTLVETDEGWQAMKGSSLAARKAAGISVKLAHDDTKEAATDGGLTVDAFAIQ